MDNLPSYIEVESTLEFSRLVCALERVPRISFLHEHSGDKVLSVQADIIEEKPIIYYTKLVKSGHYLTYGIKNGKEDSDIVDTINDPTRLYSPIIKIKSLPSSLKAGNGTSNKYHPIELEDLASLSKLSYMFEDSLFPLFTFPKNGNDKKWLVGGFVNFSEEGDSYFCHVTLDDVPTKPFLKYSTRNGTQPTFIKDPNEHGYSYLKVIRLKDTHPLVDYDQLQN